MGEINEDVLNMSVRKFLKQVGVTSQREIERIVRSGQLADKTSVTVRTTLTAEGTDLNHVVEGTINLR